MEIRILFEDEQIIVCEKPAGVAVQTKRLGQADMESLLKNRRAGKGELPYIGVVHRLDQPVSGVMVFAKTKEAGSRTQPADCVGAGGQVLLCRDRRGAGSRKGAVYRLSSA